MSPRPLDEYEELRDFARTPEPAPRARRSRRRTPRFVVQQHDARSMHWDLRLEHDGVLLSWAVPKGLPLAPRDNRLAIRTEDHPLEYLDFEGEIPTGEYGAGSMRIWDHGTYELEDGSALEEGKVHVDLDGERVQGRYMLVRTRRRGDGGEHWLLRRLDPADDPDRAPMPEHVRPMLARLGDLPDDHERWAFEVKWDGIRAIVFAQGGRIRIETRNLNDVTAQYPELSRLGRALGSHEAVLDGEILAFDDHGRPSFQALQSRLGLTSPATIRARADRTPVRFVAFDLLHLDGRDLRREPYLERRRLLRDLLDDTPHWQVPAHRVGEGQALLAAVAEQGLEGIVAKRVDSTYREASRSGSWLKVKRQRRQEFVICGWREGAGRRSGSIGALLLGYHDPDDRTQLVYAGSVGTGFSHAQLRDLRERLQAIEVDRSALDRGGPEHAGGGRWASSGSRGGTIHHVEPRFVCEVEFTEFTHDGTLRHPSFKGLRDDKSPRDVVREGG